MNKVFKFYNIAIFISLSLLFPELDEGHDIAILKLSEELDLKMYTPACLAKASEGTRFDGGKITVAGWGMTSPNVFPDKPHEVKLTVSAPSRQACALEVHDADSKMVPLVCAGKKEPGKGTCDVSYTNFSCSAFIRILQGDSGGPGTYKQKDQHILVGVVSFSSGLTECGGNITFFGRISHIRQWIDETIEATPYSGEIATLCRNGFEADDLD